MAELKAYLDASFVLEATVTGLMNLTPAPADEDDEGGVHVVPFDIRQWLARLRLLEGVPFAYLAADSELLPRESIRFFYLDRRWTDALVQGALGVGTVSSGDRAQLEQLYNVIRDEVDDEEHRVRPVGGEGATSTSQTITGFVLRSRAVSGWPGLHVRAYDRELAEATTRSSPRATPGGCGCCGWSGSRPPSSSSSSTGYRRSSTSRNRAAGSSSGCGSTPTRTA